MSGRAPRKNTLAVLSPRRPTAQTEPGRLRSGYRWAGSAISLDGGTGAGSPDGASGRSIWDSGAGRVDSATLWSERRRPRVCCWWSRTGRWWPAAPGAVTRDEVVARMSAPIWRGVACDPRTLVPLYGFVADADAIMFFPVGGFRLEDVAALQSREYALGHPGMPGEARAKAFLASADVIVRHEGAGSSVDDAIAFVRQRLLDPAPVAKLGVESSATEPSEHTAAGDMAIEPGSRLYVTAFLAAHLSICLKRHRTDSLTFGRRYVQWAPGGPGLQVEAVSDRFLEPDQQITAFGAARMRELGFQVPTDDDPNWTIWLDSELHAMEVAEPIVTALVEVYRVPLEDVAEAVGAFPQPPPARPLESEESAGEPIWGLDRDASDLVEADEQLGGHPQDVVYLVWEMGGKFPQLAATVVVRFPADRDVLPLVEVFPEPSGPGYEYLFQPWRRVVSSEGSSAGGDVRVARANEIAVELRGARHRLRTDVDRDDMDSLMAVTMCIGLPTIHMVTVQPQRGDVTEVLSELRRWVPSDVDWARWAARESSSESQSQEVDPSESLGTADPGNADWWDDPLDTVYRVWEHAGHPDRPALAARVLVSFPAGHRSVPRVEVVPELSPAGFDFLHHTWVGAATDAMVADSEVIRRQLNLRFAVLLRDWRSKARDVAWDGRAAVDGLVYSLAVPTLHSVDEMVSTVQFDRQAPVWLRSRPTPGQWTRMIAEVVVYVTARNTRWPDSIGLSAPVLDHDGRQRVQEQIDRRRASSPKIASAMQANLDQRAKESTRAPELDAEAAVPLTDQEMWQRSAALRSTCDVMVDQVDGAWEPWAESFARGTVGLVLTQPIARPLPTQVTVTAPGTLEVTVDIGEFLFAPDDLNDLMPYDTALVSLFVASSVEQLEPDGRRRVRLGARCSVDLDEASREVPLRLVVDLTRRAAVAALVYVHGQRPFPGGPTWLGAVAAPDRSSLAALLCPQWTPGLSTSARASFGPTFEDAGLGVPWIPEVSAPYLEMQSDWSWAAWPTPATPHLAPMDAYMFGPAVEQLGGDWSKRFHLCHFGHGVNSYAITYEWVGDRMSVVAQTGWGGVYMDADTSRSRVRLLSSDLDILARLSEAIARWPHERARLLVWASDFRGAKGWSWPIAPASNDRWMRQSSSEEQPVDRWFDDFGTGVGAALRMLEEVLADELGFPQGCSDDEPGEDEDDDD